MSSFIKEISKLMPIEFHGNLNEWFDLFYTYGFYCQNILGGSENGN